MYVWPYTRGLGDRVALLGTLPCRFLNHLVYAVLLYRSLPHMRGVVSESPQVEIVAVRVVRSLESVQDGASEPELESKSSRTSLSHVLSHGLTSLEPAAFVTIPLAFG